MIAAAIPAAIVVVAAVKHWVTLAWLHVKIPVETPVQTLVAAHVS